MTGTTRAARRALALSFPIAFALHDLEEVFAAEAWGRAAPDRIRARFPRAPEGVARLASVSTVQMTVAVGVVGTGVAIVTASALRDLDGDLGLLPAALAAYAGHGATHVLTSVAYGGYTPGVATVPLVIAPYSIWAARALRRAGVRGTVRRRDLAAAAGAAMGLVIGGQALGRWVDAARG